MKTINLLNIFKVFFKIGAILLGGGYVIIPIMKDELVAKNNWLKEDELLDFYCVSQCLPGIIAVNMAILTGYKIYKLKGALTGLFAMCLSPVILIIILAGMISKIISIPFIEGIFWGVNLSVIILIYLTVKEMWQKSITDRFSGIWFVLILSLCCFKINPAYLIILSILAGIILQTCKDKRRKNDAD